MQVAECACTRATSWSIDDGDTTQCSLNGLRQLSTSLLLSWALGNEESCISMINDTQ